MKITLHNQAVKTNCFIRSKLLLSLIVIFTIAALFSVKGTSVYAQNEKKVIKLANTVKPQLKFTDVKVRQQDRKFDESFNAEAEWVKSLSFKLESISDKPIVYLEVNINFPETRATGNLISYPIRFGQLPNSTLKQLNKPMLLKSGETLEVSLEKEKDRIYKFVNSRQSIESIQKVELEIGFIVFEDKTAWAAGAFLRQDANNPSKYNPIENDSSIIPSTE
jgi:hypothetical protein